jgi:hypothetical protein
MLQSKVWTIGKQDINRIMPSKMKCMRRTGGYNKWDHKRNEVISDKPKIKQVLDYIQNDQRKWKKHMNRMNTGRIPR